MCVDRDADFKPVGDAMKFFTATVCFVGEQHTERCFRLMLGDRDVENENDINTGGDAARVVIQLLEGVDAEDRQQGLDVYSVRTHSSVRHHNGIAAWRIDGTRLTLEFTSKACRVLDVDDGFVIELLPVAAQLEQIRAALSRIVDG